MIELQSNGINTNGEMYNCEICGRELPITAKCSTEYHTSLNNSNITRIDELEAILKNVPMPVLSYEQIQGRIKQLKDNSNMENK